ncbi:MAG: hypothetical protein R3F56_25830 [Planctomycetota bacterium]
MQLRALLPLAPLLLPLFAAAPLLAQPNPNAGVTTQITVQDQSPVGEPVSDADGVDLLSVTFQRSDGSLVNIPILWSWERGVSTRESIALQIATKLKRALRYYELPEEWVTTAGSIVVLTNTPKGVGKNTGTPDKPVLSPPNADHNDLHLEITTTDKDGK